MAMFGRSRGPSSPPYGTPPFNPDAGERDPVWGELAPELTAPLPKKRGMFGGLGKVASFVGDALMYGPFMGMAREGIQNRRDDRAFRRQLLESELADEQARRNRPTFQNVSGVGLVRINPDGTTETAVEAKDDPATAPAGVREWQYMQTLPPEQRDQFMRFRQPVPYGFTPAGIAAQAEIAGRTAAAREPYQNGGGADLRYKNGVPVVTSPEQLKSLPPGTVFIAPDGSRRVK